MNFTLTVNGSTPAELLEALTQLGGMTINVNTSPTGGVETHTMTAAECPRHTSPLPPQSEPVERPEPHEEKTPAKTEKTAQKPAAAQEDANGSTAKSDPATLDKIRDLSRSLIVHGKRAEVQAAIKSAGAASISKLPPESYTAVWEQLVNLSKEVDADAAG